MTRRLRLTLLASCSVFYLAVATRITGGLFRRQFANGAYGDFFDQQADALLDGHLALPSGAIGIEAFVVDGHEHMYFGVFPALLRMPLLAVTDAFEGDFTLLSSFAAWLVFVVSAWALGERLLGELAPDAAHLTWLDVAWKLAVALGSPMLMLAGPAWVFSEAIMWGVAASTLFQYRLVCELWAPSTRNQLWLGGALALAALNRPTHALGCLAVAAGLVVLRGVRNRQVGPSELRLGAFTVVAAGLLVTPNLARFGRPFGLPMDAQVISRFEEYRMRMLAYAGNDYTDLRYLPSNLLAYVRPDGIATGWRFPFITAPDSIPTVFLGAVHDITNRTPSIVASSPLLVVLGVIGLVVALAAWRRPGPHRSALFAAAAGIPAVGAHLVWGFITPRFLADFLPLLLPCSVVGLAWVARRSAAGTTAVRRGLLIATTVLTGWSVAANTGLAVEASYFTGYDGGVDELVDLQGRGDFWTSDDVQRWPDVEDFAVDAADPPPPGLIAILGDCEAAYISNGEPVDPWLSLGYGPNDFRGVYRIEVPEDAYPASIPLATLTSNSPVDPDRPHTFTVSAVNDFDGRVRLELADEFGVLEYPLDVAPGGTIEVAITSDPVRRVLTFDADGAAIAYGHYLTRILYGPDGQTTEFSGDVTTPGLTVTTVDVADPC